MAEFKAKARAGWSSITIGNGALVLKRFGQQLSIPLSSITEVAVSKSTYDLPLVERTVTIFSQGKRTLIKRLSRQKAEELQQVILTLQHAKHSTAGSESHVDVATQLEKLAKLRDAGDLTEEEFNAQKRKLLNQCE